MSLIDENPVDTVGTHEDMPTWAIHDGKRVAKFQYVGTSGQRGYFTIVPIEKSGSQQKTEYLTDRLTAMPPSGSSPTCATGLSPAARAAPLSCVAGPEMNAQPADDAPLPKRHCGRCQREFAGDPDIFFQAGWSLCPACEMVVRRSGGGRR